MNLHQIDLNLLVLFDSLYRHRSVSVAANEICISQSAFSHGLARLRKRLADELFVRVNNVMEPTPLAHSLAKSISPALVDIQGSLTNNLEFDPSTSDMELKFAATDFTQFSLLPKLIGHINKVAPHMRVTVYPSANKIPTEKLISGELDFVLGFSHEIEQSSTMEYQTWLQDSYCTIARKNHPKLKSGLSLEAFLDLSHVRISPWGEKSGVVDQQLAAKGLRRHVAIQLPNVMTAPYMVLDSDLLLTFPRVIAEHLANVIDIDIFEPPVEIPQYQLNIYWHKLNARKAAHLWLNKLVNELT